ncbi:DUF4870 domain-containing protein [Alkaliphilus peptidifermentans]|uniref:Uncharacterized membrane protein n=1 Tax=Alkaliphilus peptidifermentans DSM 18978 TaxID=1120976 RepID=A0A1G5KNJ8_9FIRM|nr:DUF4870 domain-containing protein [Alkaliphilus peptidifermentans]SCZ02165.1 Uncharacterized membrane protein [Alkaliphilus peptidifermentans DSM 18978]
MENEKKDIKEVVEIKKSSLGMDENVAALLSYLLGFITGIIFYVLEKDSRYVKFHAMQSILVSVALMVLSFVLGFIPIIGWIISLLISPLTLVLWIILLVKAYKGAWFKLPIIGDIAEKQLKDM